MKTNWKSFWILLTLLENHPDPILIIDKFDNIKYKNNKAECVVSQLTKESESSFHNFLH